MRGDIIGVIIGVVALGAALVALFVVWRLGAKAKSRIAEQLMPYFSGEISAEHVVRRIRETRGFHLVREAELFSLVTKAFQRAVDMKPAPRSNSDEDQRYLLSLLAALKTAFGLTDRYRIEGWRAGRE